MSILLPFENLTFKTKLSKDEAIEKLLENIEAQKSFGIGAHNYLYLKPYIGRFEENNFEIKRAISYRNSFLPVIKGTVYTEFDVTKIKVKMRPHFFVLIFMTVWFSGVLIGCLFTTIALLTQKFTPMFLIPYGMIIFGIALLYGGFKTESSISKKDLLRILEAEIEN